VLEWINEGFINENIFLKDVIQKIHEIEATFSKSFFNYVYMEKNSIIDDLVISIIESQEDGAIFNIISKILGHSSTCRITRRWYYFWHNIKDIRSLLYPTRTLTSNNHLFFAPPRLGTIFWKSIICFLYDIHMVGCQDVDL